LTDALARAHPQRRSAILVRLATLATYDGSMLDARDLAEQALAEAFDDPSLRVVIHRRLALAHLLLAELDVAERHAQAAVELAQTVGERPSLARALANLACIRVVRGEPVSAGPAIERALALEADPGVASIDDSPSAVAGLLSMYEGRLDTARRHLQDGLARAQALGGDPLSTGLLFAMSELETRAGRFEEALELAERGLAASEQTDQSTERSVLLFAKGLAEAHLGATEAARLAASEGLAIAQRAHHRFAEAQNRWALGLLELSLGRPTEAWSALRPAVSLLRDHHVGEPAVVPIHPVAIEALLMLGEQDEARVLLDELEAAARAPWLRAHAGRCRGLLHAAGGEADAAMRQLEASVEAHRALGDRFALARSLLALGTVQRRAKRRGAARVSLEAAERLFDELGARQWVARARSDAARLAGRRPGNRDELTPTERGIAELAAAGQSNREIADALFVSERTVEANLTRVYRKLSVRSRTELARRLPAG
jgi:DNA-binding CsgD family transcriptional regulator